MAAITISVILKLIFTIGIISLAGVCLRADDAKDLYLQQCKKCHGEDGKGQTNMGKRLGAKDYTDPKVQDELKDDAGIKAVKEGLTREGNTLMKPAEGLNDDQIKGLIGYMRTFKK